MVQASSPSAAEVSGPVTALMSTAPLDPLASPVVDAKSDAYDDVCETAPRKQQFKQNGLGPTKTPHGRGGGGGGGYGYGLSLHCFCVPFCNPFN